MSKLTELDIQLRFFWERWPKTLLVPNYTPAGWFECDIFEYTADGYFREFEIKLTNHDLVADMDKEHGRYECIGGQWVPRKSGARKHDLLAAGDPRGPAEFYYILPVHVADRADVPGYAGIFEFEEVGLPDDHLKNRISMRCTRRSKRLHSNKIDGRISDHARNTCYYRMHRLLWRLHRQKKSEIRDEGDMRW